MLGARCQPCRARSWTFVLVWDNRLVLRTDTVFSGEGVEIADVACRHAAGSGAPGEQTESHVLVFVRRGCFVRSVDGVETLLDPTVAYCINPGQEQRYDHPHAHGDDCTALFLNPSLLASLWGGDPTLPAGPLPASPRIDLAHRLLLARSRGDADPHELIERAVALTAHTLERTDPPRVAQGRPATVRARRALADAVREVLVHDPDQSLSDLARSFAVSPHHVSRVFRSLTGQTISRHRMRLRARSALERLANGDHDLARLAADTGFADQSHLCRVLRQETGHTPSALRHALTQAENAAA
jgi:AraC-like DNA-binding protein